MHPSATGTVDWLMDKSLVLGYSKIGPALRRRWWPRDAPSSALLGKHVVVTGASGGLGLATAAGLARLGAEVHLLGRSADRLESAASQLVQDQPDARVRTAVCDVSDLDSVEEFCTAISGSVTSLHALVHNAGVMPPKRTLSAQGHELTLATHVLGPHLMTFRLADTLRGGRVVVVSSGGMYGQKLPADDLEYEHGEYSGVNAYARTKRMQVVLAELWAQWLEPQGITVASMHPGWADTPGVTDSLPRFARVMGPVLRSPEEGADTVVWLAAAEQELPSGRFWHDRRPRPTHYGPLNVESEGPRALLWDFVRSQTGVPAG
jgi:NAD(P)-dependent dehydrogenase (short-subunit alcohol dehydrogenase family)